MEVRSQHSVPTALSSGANEQKAEWAREQDWIVCRRENSLLLKGFEPRPVLPAASRYTEYVIRIHVKKSSVLLMWDNPLMSAVL